MKADAKVVLRQPLHHQFSQVTLESAGFASSVILPGHQVFIQEQPCFINSHHKNQIDIIVPDHLFAKDTTTLACSAIHGDPISAPTLESFTLLIIDNALGACLFYLKKYRRCFKGLVLIGSHDPFPFLPCPSKLIIEGLPPGVIAGIPLLEDWGIPHRLASTQNVPGCFEGTAKVLADHWLRHQDKNESVVRQFFAS